MAHGCVVPNFDIPEIRRDEKNQFIDVKGALRFGIDINEIESGDSATKIYEIAFDNQKIAQIIECEITSALVVLEMPEEKVVFGVTDFVSAYGSRRGKNFFVNLGPKFTGRISIRVLKQCGDLADGNYVIAFQNTEQ